MHVILDTKPSHFSRATLKKAGSGLGTRLGHSSEISPGFSLFAVVRNSKSTVKGMEAIRERGGKRKAVIREDIHCV